MRRLLVPSLAGALALASAALPAAALAQTSASAPKTFPTVKTTSIVPGVSIGGLKLGQHYADMVKAWGTGSSCGVADAANAASGGAPQDYSDFTGFCFWSDSGSSSHTGAADVHFRDGAIDVVDLTGATSASGVPTAGGPIGKYVVAKGKTKFKMGSSIKSFEKAFPKYTIANDNAIQVAKGKQALVLGFSHGKISGMSLMYPGEY